MSTATTRHEDERTAARARSTLEWDPAIDATAVEVSVLDGVLRLSGTVSSYSERLTARLAVTSVPGVHSVLSDLHVAPDPNSWRLDDATIVAVAAAALDAEGITIHGRTLSVHDHVITIDGAVETELDRNAVHHTVDSVPGVSFVANRLRIEPRR